MQKGITYALICASSLCSSWGDVRVNELMASNTRAFPDITDFEDYPDWIELHNTGAQQESLNGYFLSDDPSEPLKWAFPENASIEAGGFLVVIADGNDAGAGSVHRRPYWPFRDFTAEKHHTNFSLSSSGETLLLTRQMVTTNQLISFGNVWRYLDDGSDQGTGWKEPGFKDSAWSTGGAPLGYGDPVTTTISFGPDDNDRHITSYFRSSFQVNNLASLNEVALRIQVDDAAVIYLNGKLIIRQNMPPGAFDFDTRAENPITPNLEDNITTYPIDKLDLIQGQNVIAVEVHQINSTSVDMRFDLEIRETSITSTTTLDTYTYPQQVTDVSLGRSSADPNVWVQFAESTPGAANGGPLVTDLRSQSEKVTISPAGGLVAAPTAVTLSCPEGSIHYTLDGSEPSSSSPLYSTPLQISETTVLRARCLAPDKIPGAISTRTYFIGEEFKGIPFLSMVAENETLFGDTIGIDTNTHEPIVSGRWPAVYKGKDAPGHLEFFPVDGSEGFAVNGGFRIGGENNWASHRQRAFNFATRGKYGDDAINYPLFPESNIPTFTSLTLREGGDDWGKAHLTDAIFDSIVRGRLEVESNKYRPAALFINGQYWGLYNIRDRWDDNWFFQHYGTNNGDFDHLSYPGTGNDVPIVENGSSKEWTDLLTYIDTHDISDPTVWAYIEERIDIDSLIDFVICESYGRNSSWTGNREHWKDNRPGSKWRWFIPDMDRTFGNSSQSPVFSSMLNREQTLKRVKFNPTFRARLAQRFAVHTATTLEESRIRSLITDLGSIAAVEIPRQQGRWGTPSQAEYQTALSRMRSFASDRSAGLVDEVQNAMGLDPAVSLTLATNGQGTFRVAGVEVESGTLRVFPNLVTEIEAIPAPGFRFDRWGNLNGGAKTTFNLTLNGIISGIFVPDSSVTIFGELGGNATLFTSPNPYIITDDLIVPSGSTLTIQPGVALEFAEGVNLRVLGRVVANGTSANKITFQGRHGSTWGGVSFENPSGQSTLTHVTVRNASRGHDALTYPAAIAGLNADVVMDFIDIDECRGPLFFRGGNTILRDSFIHIPITGDGINIKQGQAQTIRCTFLGNNSPDTDAIDYDGVVNGLIQDCRIYRFFGFNSDGIDTGEQCVDTVIEGNKIFFNSDKGISVGQGSSVIARNNLIVGCSQGVGVKDTGSTISVDQCTFVNCEQGVAVFEKNFGAGGGFATIANSIFSNSESPVSADSLSSISTSYNLADNVLLPGATDILVDPGFTNPAKLDFSLTASSAARDSGDPNHVTDPDGTRADRGARYVFDPNDYPFLINNTVVINEVLANSGNDSDWIELHNRSNESVDIGGWFLSDDGSDLAKYRIPAGTILGPEAFLIFYQDLNFGPLSTDPGKINGFGLSNEGETLHLSSAVNDVFTDYRFKEKFGASLVDSTLGFYFKPSTDTYNFVPLDHPTLAQQNSSPANGPIVISEILYQPLDPTKAEYLELLNISSDTVDLTGWQITDGITFTFPANTMIQPGERIVLAGAGDLTTYNIPAGTTVFTWTDGKLNNGGETIQLSRPDPTSGALVRVDRVNYDATAPWPITNAGVPLLKIAEKRYGNDPFNWVTGSANPGDIDFLDSFATWAGQAGVNGPAEDPDDDGIPNLVEYAIGSNPTLNEQIPPFNLTFGNRGTSVSYVIDQFKNDIDVELQGSDDLQFWLPVTASPGDPQAGILQPWHVNEPQLRRRFYRIHVTQKP